MRGRSDTTLIVGAEETYTELQNWLDNRGTRSGTLDLNLEAQKIKLKYINYILGVLIANTCKYKLKHITIWGREFSICPRRRKHRSCGSV